MYEEEKAVGKSELTTELLFSPEDGGGTLLRNVDNYLLLNTLSHPRKYYSLLSQL
jgi:hypothetical protein